MMIRLLLLALLSLSASVARGQPVVTQYPVAEGSTYTWGVDFVDDATPPAPVVPSSASWKIETLAGSVLVAPTPIAPLASHVDLVAALTFPAGEQVAGKPKLPPSVPAAITVSYSWGSGKTRTDWVWFSLQNAP